MANQEYKYAACDYRSCYKSQSRNPCCAAVKQMAEIAVCYDAAYENHGKRCGDVGKPAHRSHDKFRYTYICSQKYDSKDTDKYLVIKRLFDAFLH